MSEYLENCWEITHCGRERNGRNVERLGECPASKEAFGHSCWAIAGSFCPGNPQGSGVQKQGSCMTCEIYWRYNRELGAHGQTVRTEYPDEETKYQILMQQRLQGTDKNA